MQELMKFELEAEKRHLEFTLAALKELGNILKPKVNNTTLHMLFHRCGYTE